MFPSSADRGSLASVPVDRASEFERVYEEIRGSRSFQFLLASRELRELKLELSPLNSRGRYLLKASVSTESSETFSD